jgi:16S rRNA processing protein RimM
VSTEAPDPPDARDPDFVVVGHVSKPHGTKGELFIWPLTDRPDSTFQPGASLRVADHEGEEPDPDLAPLEVETVRAYRKGFLVTFSDVRDRNAADLLRGRYLVRPFAETEPLDEGELFYHQLLGMTVLTKEGEELGTIREIYGVRPADLLEVTGPSRSHLIPFTREIVVGWSLADRTMTIDPPAGLLDL